MTYLQKKTNQVCRIITEQAGKMRPFKKAWPVLLFAVVLAWTTTAIGAEKNKYSLPDNQWYVRLIVSTDDGRRDDGNILGRLLDSNQDKDDHDLTEMDPPPSPMGDRYLSIVFPHPEWGGDMRNYATDYHGVPDDPAGGDVWNFEVRTLTPGIQAELSWEGPTAVLSRSRLKEAGSGRILVEDCAATTSYAITLNKAGNRFIWEYLGKEAESTAATAAKSRKKGSNK